MLTGLVGQGLPRALEGANHACLLVAQGLIMLRLWMGQTDNNYD